MIDTHVFLDFKNELFHAIERPEVIIQLIIIFCVFLLAAILNSSAQKFVKNNQLRHVILVFFRTASFLILSIFTPFFSDYMKLIDICLRFSTYFLVLTVAMYILSRKIEQKLISYYSNRLIYPVFIFYLLVFINFMLAGNNQLLTVSFIKLYNVDFSLADIILLTLGVYWWFIFTSIFSKLIQRVFNFSQYTGQANKGLFILIRYFLIGVGLISIFGYVGFNSTSVGLVTGGLSIGIGLSLKELISDLASGIWLLIEGSIRPGDIINLGSISDSGNTFELGTVSEIGLRATTVIVEHNNSERIIPNQTFFNKELETFTKNHNIIAKIVYVGVSYDSDPTKVIELMEKVAKEHQYIQVDPKPYGYFIDYGESCMNFALKFWIKEICSGINVSSYVNIRIWEIFKANNIRIPFPQLDINVEKLKTSSPEDNINTQRG